LDRLDVKLVRELSQGRNVGLVWGDINPAYREMANRLGVSKETVRDRVEKMRSSGVLKVFPIQVNPELLGLDLGALLVDVPATASRRDLLGKLTLLEGILLTVSHVGSSIGMIFYYEDEPSLKKKIELISKICGATAADFTTIPHPHCTASLSTMDWKIVSALQKGRSGRASRISAELGISERTLRRRLKRLVDGWAVSTLISTDVAPLRGMVVANLMIHYTSQKLRQEADTRLLNDLDEYTFFPGLWTDYSVYSLFLPSIPEANRVLERAKETPGVKTARIELVEERMETYDALREQVERKLRPIQSSKL